MANKCSPAPPVHSDSGPPAPPQLCTHHVTAAMVTTLAASLCRARCNNWRARCHCVAFSQVPGEAMNIGGMGWHWCIGTPPLFIYHDLFHNIFEKDHINVERNGSKPWVSEQMSLTLDKTPMLFAYFSPTFIDGLAKKVKELIIELNVTTLGLNFSWMAGWSKGARSIKDPVMFLKNWFTKFLDP